MNTNSATLIFFSPTQTTRRVVEQIALGMQIGQVETLDLTPPVAVARSTALQVGAPLDTDLAIIGMPVYGGRLPKVAVERLRRVDGRGRPAALVVVYGNREFEDALLELHDLAVEIGFRPAAGAAFIAEHSFSTDDEPIAPGRPDREDLALAADFGRRMSARLWEIAADGIPPLRVPGNFPYKTYPGNTAQVSPLTDEAVCQLCGACAAACPTGAVTLQERVVTDPAGCILCCACVRACPEGGRVMDNAPVNQSRTWLNTACREPKQPVMFL